MKLKNKIIKIALIILMLILIYAPFLSNITYAAIGDFTSWSDLQSAAASGSADYFAGSTKDLMLKKRIFTNTHGTNMGVYAPGNVCIAPNIHAEPDYLQPTCVMDVSETGDVTVSWVSGGNVKTRTTTYADNPEAVKVAYMYCYFAYKAQENGECTPYPSGDCGTYQWQIKWLNGSGYFSKYMHDVLGVPLYFSANYAGYTINFLALIDMLQQLMDKIT